MNASLRNFALWVIIVLLLLALFTLFQNPSERTFAVDISFSQFLNEVDAGRVRDVRIQGSEVLGTFTDGRRFLTHVLNEPALTSRLQSKGVAITVRPPGDNVPWFISLLVSWLPFVALIGVWIYLSRKMQASGGGVTIGGPPVVSRNEFEGLRRQIADMQAEIDRLKSGQK